MTLDRNDKRILALLEGDARMSVAAIGRSIGLSRPAVQARIRVMEDAGAILGYHTIVGAQAGLIHAIMFVKITERPCDKALSWLLSLEGVISAVSLAGEIDALLSVTAPTTSHLSALNDRVAASPLVSSAYSHIVLRSYNPVTARQ